MAPDHNRMADTSTGVGMDYQANRHERENTREQRRKNRQDAANDAFYDAWRWGGKDPDAEYDRVYYEEER